MKLATLILLLGTFGAAATPILHSRPEAWVKLYMDGDSAPWTASAAQQVQTWQIVADLYAPFNIDVTTEYPGPRYNVAWVIIGGPLQGAIAGRAGVGSYGAGTLYGSANAGEVYADGLGNDPVTVGIAIAHEAGHLIGLEHQTQGVMAPIIQSTLTTWSKGINESGVYQDDVAFIGSQVGFASEPPLPEPSAWWVGLAAVATSRCFFRKAGV